jgi:anti-sigma factor RsiW
MTDDLACDEVVVLVTEYLEGSLPEAQARRLERHLEACDGCTVYVEQIRSIAGSLGTLGAAAIPPAMRAGLITAFRRSRGPG